WALRLIYPSAWTVVRPYDSASTTSIATTAGRLVLVLAFNPSYRKLRRASDRGAVANGARISTITAYSLTTTSTSSPKHFGTAAFRSFVAHYEPTSQGFHWVA